MEILNELISYGEKRVKIVGTSEEPWFCGKDVCEILEYSNSKKALQLHIKSKHKKALSTLVSVGPAEGPTAYNEGKTVYISEPGLYSLINKCSLPIAEKFQDWIFEEILPSIRKKGEYKLQKALEESISTSAIQKKEFEEKIEMLERQTLQLTNYVTNVKTRTQGHYFYIASTVQYSSQNNFKLGHTDNLKNRLATYNTGRVSTDLYRYCYTRKVFDGQKIDKLVQDLLGDYKETTKKENIIMHYTYLERIIDFIIKNCNATYEFLNEFIKNDLAKSYKLRPVEIQWIVLEPTIVSADNKETMLSDLTGEQIKKLIADIIELSKNKALTRRIILDSLSERYIIKGYFFSRIWVAIKEVAKEKQLEIKYR